MGPTVAAICSRFLIFLSVSLSLSSMALDGGLPGRDLLQLAHRCRTARVRLTRLLTGCCFVLSYNNNPQWMPDDTIADEMSGQVDTTIGTVWMSAEHVQ